MTGTFYQKYGPKTSKIKVFVFKKRINASRDISTTKVRKSTAAAAH